ncbi:tetratricopeptide (TPR) repeat protein [Massilia aurea]|uniref:Tetratricopeptide (TPR) repeat protein n=1 Tax=Massilia aurea TaxID=373040 RepID=A0A7X0CEN2_9BURK|nr:LytR C-terminal domain-containing protein [Massilia aurea]MBB6134248.1 tetratricopeptide (TPR) repeat protein [Massilia aurea]
MRPTIHRSARFTRLALLCAGLAACAPLQTPGSHATSHDLNAALQADAGPDAAQRFVTLGSASLRSGDYDAARVALERACLLDPLVAHSWELLGEALAALGQEARARQMLRQAASLRQYDLRADFAATGGQTGVAALGQAMAALQPTPQPGWAQAQIHVGADGMMELRRIPASAPVLQSAVQPLPLPPAVARLEISNGNGVTGMARALARQIDAPSLRVTRLSNQPGFAVRHTRIEYDAAHVDAARRLAQRVGSVHLQEVDHRAPANLRLVLGRDLAPRGAMLRLDAKKAESLALR